jgi:hypothetical protein
MEQSCSGSLHYEKNKPSLEQRSPSIMDPTFQTSLELGLVGKKILNNVDYFIK